MDDEFDDLFVPDNWLDTTDRSSSTPVKSAGKRYLESTEVNAFDEPKEKLRRTSSEEFPCDSSVSSPIRENEYQPHSPNAQQTPNVYKDNNHNQMYNENHTPTKQSGVSNSNDNNSVHPDTTNDNYKYVNSFHSPIKTSKIENFSSTSTSFKDELVKMPHTTDRTFFGEEDGAKPINSDISIIDISSTSENVCSDSDYAVVEGSSNIDVRINDAADVFIDPQQSNHTESIKTVTAILEIDSVEPTVIEENYLLNKPETEHNQPSTSTDNTAVEESSNINFNKRINEAIGVLTGVQQSNGTESLETVTATLEYDSEEKSGIEAVATTSVETNLPSKPDTEQSNQPSTSTERTPEKVKKIISIMRDAKIVSGIVGNDNFSFNDIYDGLLKHREREDRLDYVTSLLLDGSNTSSSVKQTPGGATPVVDIFEEVQQVLNCVPSADANHVYAILESLPPFNRVETAKFTLQTEGHTILKNPPPTLDNNSSSPSTSDSSPLARDLQTLTAMFPDKDKDFISILLDTHEGEKRLQNVINELLMREGAKSSSLDIAQPSTSAAADLAEIEETTCIEDDVDSMKILFPDCDPNYLFERLEAMKDTPNRKDVLAAELFDKKQYPKWKDVLEKEEQTEKLKRMRDLNITFEEFDKKFKEPEKTFSDETKPTTASYKIHTEIALKNDFRMLSAAYIKTVLYKHNHHLYTAYKDLSASVVGIPLKERRQHRRFLKSNRGKLAFPDQPDELFYHEFWFVQNELKLADHAKQVEEERKKKLAEAKEKGELYECCCCYDDECLFEDMASCPEGHLFCKVCVVRSTEAAFGEMKTIFPCLTGECGLSLPLSTLQAIVPANLFSKIVRRMQEEEVQQANIPDLVVCPFCPFATIMPNPEDKVFKCLNPECLKESCRLCKEPNHIPLRCNEIEQQSATKMRTYIENCISEAVMRKCHKCGKNFIKDSGCNKMTCVCGATSCYFCKAKDITYDHFNQNKTCANTDPNTIHQRDMERAAVEAKQQYLRDHPDAVEVELKTDVKDMIDDYRKLTGKATRGNFGPGMNEGDSEEEDEEEEDEYDEEEEEEYYDRYDRYGYRRRYYDDSDEDEEEEDYYY